MPLQDRFTPPGVAAGWVEKGSMCTTTRGSSGPGPDSLSNPRSRRRLGHPHSAGSRAVRLAGGRAGRPSRGLSRSAFARPFARRRIARTRERLARTRELTWGGGGAEPVGGARQAGRNRLLPSSKDRRGGYPEAMTRPKAWPACKRGPSADKALPKAPPPPVPHYTPVAAAPQDRQPTCASDRRRMLLAATTACSQSPDSNGCDNGSAP